MLHEVDVVIMSQFCKHHSCPYPSVLNHVVEFYGSKILCSYSKVCTPPAYFLSFILLSQSFVLYIERLYPK